MRKQIYFFTADDWYHHGNIRGEMTRSRKRYLQVTLSKCHSPNQIKLCIQVEHWKILDTYFFILAQTHF